MKENIMNTDELKQLNEVRNLVLKQVDTIIEKYTPERGEKFFTNDIQSYLLTVGSGMIAVDEYYQFPNKELADKVHKAFVKESQWYPKHCATYCKAIHIQTRLKKFRERIIKILSLSKPTKAEEEAFFRAITFRQLDNLHQNLIKVLVRVESIDFKLEQMDEKITELLTQKNTTDNEDTEQQ